MSSEDIYEMLVSALGEEAATSLLSSLNSGEMSEMDLVDCLEAYRIAQEGDAREAERLVRDMEEAQREMRLERFEREEAAAEARMGVGGGGGEELVHPRGEEEEGEGEGEGGEDGSEDGDEDRVASALEEAALEAHEIAMAVARVERAEEIEKRSPRRGLSKSTLSRLPRFPFTPSPRSSPVHRSLDLGAPSESLQQREEDDDDVDWCVICQEYFTEGETLLVLPCFHKFHNDCIEPWLEGHHKCPTCNSDVKLPEQGTTR